MVTLPQDLALPQIPPSSFSAWTSLGQDSSSFLRASEGMAFVMTLSGSLKINSPEDSLESDSFGVDSSREFMCIMTVDGESSFGAQGADLIQSR